MEKSPPSDGTGGITAGDLSTQSIIGAVCIYPPYRHIPPLEMTMLAGTIGHTFGMRVHRAQKGRFLRLTGPKAGGFLSLTGPLAPRVVVSPSWAMSTKSALRDWLYGSYGMIRMLVIGGSLRSPPRGGTAEWYMKYMTLCFTAEWYMKYMTLCFSSPYFSFPLEGNASKRQRVYKAVHRFDTPSLS